MEGKTVWLDSQGAYFKILQFWKVNNDYFANMVIDRQYSVYFINMYKFTELEKKNFGL